MISISSNKRLGLTIINNLVTHELKGSLSIENTGTGASDVHPYI